MVSERIWYGGIHEIGSSLFISIFSFFFYHRLGLPYVSVHFFLTLNNVFGFIPEKWYPHVPAWLYEFTKSLFMCLLMIP